MIGRTITAGGREPGAPGRWHRAWLYGLIALAGAVMATVASSRNVPAVLRGGLIDPDSFMRLVRIEQGLRSGHLVNMVQRDESGAPLLIEWSRLFDAMIVALAAPLAEWLGWHRALLIAGVATGPLSAGWLSAALAFAVAPITGEYGRRRQGRGWLWIVPLVGPLLPGIRGFASFGVIHYHIAQLAAVAATAGFALRTGIAPPGDGRPAAWLSGIAGGFALWLMPETMPFVLLSFVALGYVWLFRPIGDDICALGLGFAGTLLLALLIDPPHGGILTIEIDRLSIVYAALGGAVAAAGIGLAALDRVLPVGARRGGAGMTAALAGFGLWLAVFPRVALGPYALIPPRDMAVFFGHMSETQPVHAFGEAAMLLGPGGLALLYGTHRAWRAWPDRMVSGLWLVVCTGTALSLALTARFVIFQQYPAGFAAALLPVALCEVSSRWAAQPRRAASARIGTIMLVLLAPYAPSLARAATSPAPDKSPACRLRHIAPMMRAAAGAIVLSPPADVPELLYRTRIIGVGSLYQHGIDGYLRAWHAWRAPAAAGESAAFAASGARFVLFCPGGRHDPLADHAQKDALWSMLSAHQPPPWLTLVADDGHNGFRLYRVEGPHPGGSGRRARAGKATGAAIHQP